MPAADADLRDDPPDQSQPARLPFPPITRSHILHCSVHFWHPLFRTLTPKTRLVPLSQAFIDYLGADGIILPPEDTPQAQHPRGSGGLDSWSDSDDDDETSNHDPSQDWPDVHSAVRSTIAELGGRVHPKLNWSAPKDATWISTANSMECTSANEIYLLLKSSDFVSHDLTLAFDGCADGSPSLGEVPYHLVLRKSIPSIMTSMEFRCFVKGKALVGICQRELNHYDFLPSLLPTLQRLISDFFTEKIRDTFPDPDFVFDVYIPHPESEAARVWLIDVNPWAPRTDPLLFSWMELLSDAFPSGSEGAVQETNGDGNAETDEDEEDIQRIDFRIVKRDDPEAYSFSTPLYSAHKLPREVVEAGMSSGGIREFIESWNNVQVNEDTSGSDEG